MAKPGEAAAVSLLGGLPNAIDDAGGPGAPAKGEQCFGPVNISDLTVGWLQDAIFVIGIFYQNSSGTVDQGMTINAIHCGALHLAPDSH